jgi:hypothetical protein
MDEAGHTLFKGNEAAVVLMELRAGMITVLRLHKTSDLEKQNSTHAVAVGLGKISPDKA